MKKKTVRRIIIVALAFICAGLSAVSVNMYRELKEEREKTAQANLNNWSEIQIMTNKIELMVKSSADIKEQTYYQNTVLYIVSLNLIPSFGTQETLKSYFLTTVYDPFVQDLSRMESGERLEEGYKLYMEMNSELKSICEQALECDAEELLDENSEEYNKITNRIKDYCDKYYDLISDYNKQ